MSDRSVFLCPVIYLIFLPAMSFGSELAKISSNTVANTPAYQHAASKRPEPILPAKDLGVHINLGLTEGNNISEREEIASESADLLFSAVYEFNNHLTPPQK